MQVLIEEVVLPMVGGPLLGVTMDLRTFTYTGSAERTIDGWTEILDAAGLEIAEVRPFDSDFGSAVAMVAKKGSPK